MNYLCIFARPPVPGKTKSRLAKTIGVTEAANLSEAMLEDLCEMALQTSQLTPLLWGAPGSRKEDFACVPSTLPFYKQKGEDLGEIMAHALETLFAMHSAEKVLLIGSDCISHTSLHLEKVLSLLDQCPVIFQPALDGGYVLVGQSSLHKEMFENIPWGTGRVASLTRKSLLSNKILFQELPPTFDVDTEEDLFHLKEESSLAKHKKTASWLSRHFVYGFFLLLGAFHQGFLNEVLAAEFVKGAEKKEKISSDWQSLIRKDLFLERNQKQEEKIKSLEVVIPYLVKRVLFLKPTHRAVILHSHTHSVHYVKVGDLLDKWIISSIEPKGVQVKKGDETVFLKWDER